jgi:hypothetical protein
MQGSHNPAHTPSGGTGAPSGWGWGWGPVKHMRINGFRARLGDDPTGVIDFQIRTMDYEGKFAGLQCRLVF